MSDTATVETVVEAPAPGSLAALAAADDVRGFMAAREAQLRGEHPPAAAQTPASGDPAVADPAAVGDAPPADGVADPVEDEAAAAAKASEAGKTLNEAKKRKLTRVEELKEEIDTFTFRKHRAREAAEAEEARVAAILARRQQLEQDATAKPAAVEAFDPGPKPQTTEPAAPGYCADYDSYVEALAEWKAKPLAHAAQVAAQKAIDEALKARDDRAAQHVQQQQAGELEKAHLARVEAFAKKTPDYLEKMQAMATADYRMPNDMVDFMVTCENGPAVAYELANHPEEFRAIAAMSPRRMVAALGRLEGTILARVVAPKSGTPPARNPVNSAAKPIQPVGTSAVATAVPSRELAETDPIAFMRQRDQEEMRRRKSGR